MVLDREIFNELKMFFAGEHATAKFLIHFIAHTYGNAGFSLSYKVLIFVKKKFGKTSSKTFKLFF